MPINTKETFLELVSNYHEKPERFLFFVGAGLSQPLFPSWKNLLKEFLKQAKEGDMPHEEQEILEYIDKGENYLDVAEVCVNAMGNSRYRDIMERIFDKEFSENEITEGYQALMDLSPQTIITTNYDRIPDIAGKGEYRVITNKNTSEGSRFLNNNKKIVFKIHGDITDHSSIVLTTSDYQEIIHNNQSNKSFLSSLFSTKIVVFVGFSLSDPHMDSILSNLKSINNGIPLSHYVLLNESSSFKISSFEKKYGVKIISYTPSDKSHSEVVKFLKALNHETKDVDRQIKTEDNIVLSDVDSLVEYLDKAVENLIVGSGISIFYYDSDIHLSFTPSGETRSEIQKEILSIIKLMRFECPILEHINIYIAHNAPPDIDFSESHLNEIKAKIKFAEAKQYARKEISTSTVWKLLEFYTPAGLADIFQMEEKIKYSMNTGIIGGFYE